ncbi:MAG: hypothetical protein ACE366_28790 [Bradymonadia bacterium]
MSRIDAEYTLAHAATDLEDLIISGAWLEPLTARVGQLSVDASEPIDRGDMVERTYRLVPSSTPFPGFDGAWTLETIYTRPAHRLEYVVIPQDARLAPWAINKGQVSVHPAGEGHTRLVFEGISRCRLPVIKRWVDRWAAGRTEKLFNVWVEILTRQLQET